MSEFEREYAWDAEVMPESAVTVLPAGEYRFEVKRLERRRTTPGEKLPECNMAKLTLHVTNGKEEGIVFDNIVLHPKFSWKIVQFFCSVGYAKRGEPVKMNWSIAEGAKGGCIIGIDSYKNSRGETVECNRIEKYCDDVSVAPAPENASRKWTPGRF